MLCWVDSREFTNSESNTHRIYICCRVCMIHSETKSPYKVKNQIELLEKTDSERAGQLTVFKDAVESAIKLQLNKIPTAGMSSLKADVLKVNLAGHDVPIIHKIVIAKASLFNSCVTMRLFQIAMSRVSESSSQVYSTTIRCIGS